MKFLAALLLAILAITYVQATSECIEERAKVCADILLQAAYSGSEEEDLCRELRSSMDCLKGVADKCQEERSDEVEEGIQEFEKLLRETCPTEGNEVNDDSEAIDRCVEENEEYLLKCATDASEVSLNLLLEKGVKEVNEDALTCFLYSAIGTCFVERVREKCGDKAAGRAEDEMSDAMPVEIRDACEAADEIETHDFDFLDDKRKK